MAHYSPLNVPVVGLSSWKSLPGSLHNHSLTLSSFCHQLKTSLRQSICIISMLVTVITVRVDDHNFTIDNITYKHMCLLYCRVVILELWSSLQRKNLLHRQCQKNNQLRRMRSRLVMILTVQRKLVDVFSLKINDLLLVFCHCFVTRSFVFTAKHCDIFMQRIRRIGLFAWLLLE